jgi:hypothetical protein
MRNLAETLQTISIKDTYILTYQVYKAENAARLNVSVDAQLLVKKTRDNLCLDYNVGGSPKDIATALGLLFLRAQRAKSAGEILAQIATITTIATQASAILVVHNKHSPNKKFIDVNEIDSFTKAHEAEIIEQQRLIDSELNALFLSDLGKQEYNLDLSLDDLSFVQSRKICWELFEELEKTYSIILKIPNLNEQFKTVIQELSQLTPVPRRYGFAIPLLDEDQTKIIRILNTKAQSLTPFITLENETHVLNILKTLEQHLYPTMAETIKSQLIAYKIYLEKTYGTKYADNPHPYKKFEAINAMLDLFDAEKFVPGRLEKFAVLLASESNKLSSFQSRNDPGISPLQWLKAIGHAIRIFFKKLVDSEYEPVSKGGELVASLNEILGVVQQPSHSPEKNKKQSQSHDIPLENLASAESDNVARVQPGILNNPGCTRATNPFGFYKLRESEMTTLESEAQASASPTTIYVS